MATVNPYLYFNGNCEEAFKFYEGVFRAEISYIGRYEDVPKKDRHIFQEKDEKKIMHVTLDISEETCLNGADYTEGYEALKGYSNFGLIIHSEGKDEADRLFNELSEGGQKTLPMHTTFWGSYYGNCVDKFGIMWKITT
ncbi:VOC family protein [Maribacter algarum]|uniref:VOC family protein n=1 Tax=Maribacter algarum (ex Zhang et al. 2020) TaxID=2578118 RepID=A0A5S3PSR8_9FLAO|nr:VOC family protein [Maribacter algarum]TMM58046.1 VOC family protein [Maribacter algarum]